MCVISMCVIAMCVIARERASERDQPGLGRGDGGPRSPKDRRVRELFCGSFGGVLVIKNVVGLRFNLLKRSF